MSGETPEITVTAYVRPSLLERPISDALARLDRLEGSRAVAAVEVVPWPRAVPYTGRPMGPVLETYRRFRSWAEAAGVEIHPPFELREVSSMILGDATRLRLPALCLAVEVDGRLTGVYPHSTGAAHRSVTDALDRLERGDLRAEEPASSPSVAEGGLQP